MALTEEQKDKIKSYIRDLVVNKLEDFKERDDMNKPFYFHLLSKEIVISASFLHSLYTALGGKWEKIAKLIAEEKYGKAYKGVIRGEITDNARSEIDNILDELDRKKKKPNIKQEKERLLRANQEGEKKEIDQEVDLTIEKENFVFLEIKSVKPNKNEMKAAKRDLLKLLAMKENSEVYLVIPYNPYFSEEFKRWTVIKFFEEEEDLLVGKDFWDYLGGDGTYDDILEVFESVGGEVKEKLKDFSNKI